MRKKVLNEIEVAGKRVLVRVDFNVPVQEGQITDDKRIRAALPTLQYLLGQGCAVILMSHFGRPKGKPNPDYSLAPVAEHLSRLLNQPVHFLSDCVGEAVEQAVMAMQPGEIALLENVRFHAEEEANDATFAAQLARLGEIYVNDAFGSAHRAHASTEGVAHHLPAVAGLLMQRELEYLQGALSAPARPFVSVLGGAKVHDKIGVIDNLLPKVDRLLIGGGMAFTFLKAQGHEIGKSLLDEESLDYARRVLADAGAKLVLPVDVVVAPELSPEAPVRVVAVNQIPADQLGADIGPETARLFGEIVHDAKTTIWNGPMGVFEMEPFAGGTRLLLQALAESNGTTILGGGDTAAAAEIMGFADKMTHVSTGGGATLELLEGKVLPGVAALMDA